MKPRVHVSQYLYKFQHKTLNHHIAPLTYLLYKEFLLEYIPLSQIFPDNACANQLQNHGPQTAHVLLPKKKKKYFYSDSNLRGKAPTDYPSMATAARPGRHIHAGVKCTICIYLSCNFSSSSGVALGSNLLVSQYFFCVF